MNFPLGFLGLARSGHPNIQQHQHQANPAQSNKQLLRSCSSGWVGLNNHYLIALLTREVQQPNAALGCIDSGDRAFVGAISTLTQPNAAPSRARTRIK